MGYERGYKTRHPIFSPKKLINKNVIKHKKVKVFTSYFFGKKSQNAKRVKKFSPKIFTS